MKDFLKHFVGKCCTINTTDVNFRYKPEQMMDYFMGVIEDINEEGIFLVHPITKCKSFIFFSHIIAIAEEQVLYEDNPDHAKIIEEYRKEKPITAAKTVITKESQIKEPSPFVNVAAMADMAKKIKELQK
jgi:hypothetical protein